jgi:hypothetical protein
MFELAAAHSVAKFMGCMCFGLALMTSLLVIRALCIVPFSSFSHACWALLVICIATTLIGAISVAQMLRHMLNTFVYYSNSGGVTAEPYDIKDPTNILHVFINPRPQREPRSDLELHRPSPIPYSAFWVICSWFTAHGLSMDGPTR